MNVRCVVNSVHFRPLSPSISIFILIFLSSIFVQEPKSCVLNAQHFSCKCVMHFCKIIVIIHRSKCSEITYSSNRNIIFHTLLVIYSHLLLYFSEWRPLYCSRDVCMYVYIIDYYIHSWALFEDKSLSTYLKHISLGTNAFVFSRSSIFLFSLSLP